MMRYQLIAVATYLRFAPLGSYLPTFHRTFGRFMTHKGLPTDY